MLEGDEVVADLSHVDRRAQGRYSQARPTVPKRGLELSWQPYTRLGLVLKDSIKMKISNNNKNILNIRRLFKKLHYLEAFIFY